MNLSGIMVIFGRKERQKFTFWVSDHGQEEVV